VLRYKTSWNWFPDKKAPDLFTVDTGTTAHKAYATSV